MSERLRKGFSNSRQSIKAATKGLPVRLGHQQEKRTQVGAGQAADALLPLARAQLQSVAVCEGGAVPRRLGLRADDQPTSLELLAAHSVAVVDHGGDRFGARVNVELHGSGIRVERVLPELGNCGRAVGDLFAAEVIDGAGAGLKGNPLNHDGCMGLRRENRSRQEDCGLRGRAGRIARQTDSVTVVTGVPPSETKPRTKCEILLVALSGRGGGRRRGNDGGCINHGHVDGIIPALAGMTAVMAKSPMSWAVTVSSAMLA